MTGVERELVVSTSTIAPLVWWYLSLRKTPYRLWFIWTLLVMCLTFGTTLSFQHVTLAGGFIAGIIGMGALVWIPALVTELTAASNPKDVIATYRKDIKQNSPKKKQRWVIATESTKNDVTIYIKAGNTQRYIGQADPIENMDQFMDIKAKADQAAETYNSLKIGHD